MEPQRIEDVERRKYQQMWGIREYRRYSPAEQELANVLAWLKKHEAKHVLDLGCGTGRLAKQLNERGYSVRMVDIAENCLDPSVRDALSDTLTFETTCLWSNEVWRMRADAVICIDVLEHIPEDRVTDVVLNLKTVAPHGYVNAALYKDGFGARIGQRLHMTVKPAGWWFERFSGCEQKVRGNDAWMIW